MDSRTTQLLTVLDAPALDLLVFLLSEPMTEKGLCSLSGLNQPQVHKKLSRLEKAGLIEHPAGESGRGLLWEVVAHEATRRLISALLSLTEALDNADQATRNVLRERLEQAPKVVRLRK
jgi:DNA-binding MarR family transcriptional regulator